MKMSVQNGQIGLNGLNVLLHVMEVSNLESGSAPYPEIQNLLNVGDQVKEIKQFPVMKILVQLGLHGLSGQNVQQLVEGAVSIEPENV